MIEIIINFSHKDKMSKWLKTRKKDNTKRNVCPPSRPSILWPPTPSSFDPPHDALHTKCSKKYWDTLSSHKAISEYPISNEICLFVHHFKAIQNLQKDKSSAKIFFFFLTALLLVRFHNNLRILLTIILL